MNETAMADALDKRLVERYDMSKGGIHRLIRTRAFWGHHQHDSLHPSSGCRRSTAV